MRKIKNIVLVVGITILIPGFLAAGTNLSTSATFPGTVASAPIPTVKWPPATVSAAESVAKDGKRDRSDTGRTIAELQAMAQAVNPAVAVLDQRIEAARGSALQAGLPYNPKVGYDSEDIGVGGRAGKHGLVISQEFMTGGKRTNAQNAGQWEVEALVRQRESVSLGVSNEVRLLACRVLAARQLVSVRTQLKKLADSTEQQAREYRRVGEISELNLLQLSVQAQQAGLEVIAAENAQTAAERELLAVIGDETGTLGPISDSLTDLLEREESDETVFLNRILAESPQIREAEMIVRQCQAVIAVERSKAKSNVTVGGKVYYDTEDQRSIAAASFSIPIGVYDQNQGNIARAQAGYGAAVREVERLQLSIRQNCVRVYQNYQTARREAVVYRDNILPSLKTAHEMNYQAFQQGQIGFLEFSTGQVSYYEASAKFIESLESLAIAITLLDGLLIDGPSNP